MDKESEVAIPYRVARVRRYLIHILAFGDLGSLKDTSNFNTIFSLFSIPFLLLTKHLLISLRRYLLF